MLAKIRVVLPDDTQYCPDGTAPRGQVGLHREAMRPCLNRRDSEPRAERPCLGSKLAECPGMSSRVRRVPREVSWASPAGAPGPLPGAPGAPGGVQCEPGGNPSRVRRVPPGGILGEPPSCLHRMPSSGGSQAEPFRRAQL